MKIGVREEPPGAATRSGEVAFLLSTSWCPPRESVREEGLGLARVPSGDQNRWEVHLLVISSMRREIGVAARPGQDPCQRHAHMTLFPSLQKQSSKTGTVASQHVHPGSGGVVHVWAEGWMVLN
jgi:hypothetical protein